VGGSAETFVPIYQSTRSHKPEVSKINALASFAYDCRHPY